MTFTLMASIFSVFCTNALGIDPKLLGTLVIVWTIWDAVNDPLMGALMDKAFAKKQNPRGKFRPWILRATPLLAVSKQHDVFYMAGSTSEDMMPPILYKMAKDWCAAQKMPSYAWFFDRQLPGDENGAWHSADLWYWFGTLPNGWRPWTQKDYALSEQMVSYLCSFVRTGDPNASGDQPSWQPASAKNSRVMIIGESDAHMAKPSLLKMIKTMLTNKAVGE